MVQISYKTKSRIRKILVYCVAIVTVVAINSPFFWVVSSSLRTINDLYRLKPSLLPPQLSLEQYYSLLDNTRILAAIKNSMLIAIGVTVITVLVSSTSGYALSRFRYPFKKQIRQVLFTVYMFPPVMVGLSVVSILSFLHLYDTLQGLVLAHLTRTIPFSTLIMWPFFESIPKELDEMATIDGASRIRLFFSIILPTAISGIISIAIFSFFISWNDYVFALFVLRSASMQTVPLLISSFLIPETGFMWEWVLSSVAIITIPAIISFAVLEERLVKGFGAIG